MISYFLNRWSQVPLKAQGVILAAIPLLAILTSTSFAFWGSRQRHNAEIDVSRKFEMVAHLSELLTLTVNAETGVRGYLLTQRSEFLEPYQKAKTLLPKQLGQLDALAKAEPGLKPRLDKISRVARMKSLVNQQIQLLDTLQQESGTGQLYSLLTHSKVVEDKLRVEVRDMHSEEKRLLSERLQEIAEVRSRDYIAIFLTLFIAIICRFVAGWMFNVGIGNRIQWLCENSRCLSRGEELPHKPTGKPDALGDLERELALVADQLKK